MNIIYSRNLQNGIKSTVFYYFVFLFAFLHIFSICKITEIENKIKKLYQLLKKSYTFHLLYSLTYLNNFSHKMTFQNIS